MKLKINKKIRLGFIIFIVITTIIFSYLIYSEAYHPVFEEQTTSVYSYSNKSSINYSVYLKPNNLYPTNKLEEGKLYITEFVDYLDTNLNYEFTGEQDADIKGEYNIIAKIRGYLGEGEKTIDIWEKDFPIILNKFFKSDEGKISINEGVKLNLNEYNTFVKEIKDATKINCQTSLILLMNINLMGTTSKGPIEESISSNLVIPLDVAMFEITGNNIIDKPGAIEETVQVQLPVNKTLIIIYGIILVLLIIGLILLVFFAQVAPVKDPLEKELNKIFKKYGDRLVALNSDIDIKDSIAIVKSIEDLVKISDEVGKPILYKCSDGYRGINKFYISIENKFFVLNLEYLKNVEQIENNDDTQSDNTIAEIKIES